MSYFFLKAGKLVVLSYIFLIFLDVTTELLFKTRLPLQINRWYAANALTSQVGEKLVPVNYPINLSDSELDKIMPLAGISKSQTLVCQENSDPVTYLSDRHGFNNPDSVWDEEVRGALIGDSFTHGACVDNTKNIQGHLLSSFGLSTINLGFGGSSQLYQLAVINEYIDSIDTSHVFWIIFVGNDSRELKTEYQHPWLRQYLKHTFSQQLSSRQTEIDEFWTQYSNSFTSLLRRYTHHLRLFNLMNVLGIMRAQQEINRPLDEMTENVLRQIHVIKKGKQVLEDKNKKLTVVVLPDRNTFKISAVKREYNLLIASLRDASIDTLDLRRFLDKEVDAIDQLYVNKSFHYSPEGYRVVANAIKSGMQDHSE